MDLNTQVHFTGRFLPWHRWFLYAVEGALKSKCGFNGVSPYWNWTIDAPDFYESSFWKDSNPQSGLGGWGDPNADYSISDGGFSKLQLSYPTPHTLHRNFTLRPFDIPFLVLDDPTFEANRSFLAPAVEKILEISDYKEFQKEVEAKGPHGAVHLIVGADLAGNCPTNAPNCIPGSKWSPNDPLFWLHHGMIDKLCCRQSSVVRAVPQWRSPIPRPEFDDASGRAVSRGHDRRCDEYDLWYFVLRL